MFELMFVVLFQVATASVPGPESTEAQPSTPPAAITEPAAAAPAADGSHNLRCRREQVTGSRLTRRVCTTRSGDQTLADDSRDALNRLQSQVPAGGFK